MQTYPTGYAESHRIAEQIFREILPRHGMAVREEQIALCHEILDTLYNKEISMCEAGVGIGDVDWLIPHQANIRIIQATGKRLGVPVEKVIATVGQHGNTSAASIPLALDLAVRDGRIQRGHRILLEGVGGGFTWGAALLEF